MGKEKPVKCRNQMQICVPGRREAMVMLVIKTEFGDFGHPKDLLHYMKQECITEVHIRVQYCFEDVFEKDMTVGSVSKWVATFISPVAGTLEDAIKWLRLGGE